MFIVLVLVSFILLFKMSGREQESVILFYSTGCVHCQTVEQFLQDNKIETKFSFIKREVSNNQENADLLFKKTQGCGMGSGGAIDLPFLWDGSKCLIGKKEIIKFFQQKIGGI